MPLAASADRGKNFVQSHNELAGSKMKRSEDRILTTHVGSMIRPPELVAMGKTVKDFPETQARYDALLNNLVVDAVKKQVDAGIDIDIPRAITGVPTWACISPIKYTGQAALNRGIAALKAATAKIKSEEVFMTAVAPASSAYDGVNEYYKNEHDYIFAIAEAMREEYQAIYKAGFVLQVDDALITNYYDYLTSISPARYREWAELCIAALNHALEGIPEDRIRYHICFGSWHVPHTTDAPLEALIDIVLKVKAGAYSIEAANVRHEHEWRVWEKVKLAPGK